MRTPVRFLPIVFVLALLAAACMGGDDEGGTTMDSDGYGAAYPATTMAMATTTAPAFSGAPGEGEDTAGRDTDAQGVVAVLQPGDFGRSIVYTAGLEIEVDDVVAAGRRALVELQGLGGVLFGQETTSGPEPRSVLTIKVLPENFAAALERLAGLGTLISQNVYADDVTERVVDLQSRVSTAEASVERLREFLAGATTMADVAELEAQLLQRETDLEVLRGQLRTLEDQVALATIVLVLTQPYPGPEFEMVQTAYPGHDGGAGCPGSEEVSLDEGAPFTVCYEVVNTGDTFLGDLEVRDEGLDLDPDDLIVLAGDPAALLPPGGRLLVAYEGEADPGRYPGPSLKVSAVDSNGAPLHLQVAESVERLTLEVAPDDSLPGFGDALSSAWHGLQRFGGALVLVGGALLPWLWVPALLVLAWWWLRRRRRAAATPPAAPPAPPGEPTEG